MMKKNLIFLTAVLSAVIFTSCSIKDIYSKPDNSSKTTIVQKNPGNGSENPADSEGQQNSSGNQSGEDPSDNTGDNDQGTENPVNKPNNDPLNNLNLDESKLNNTKRAWYYNPHTDGTPSGEPKDVLDLLSKYSGYYLGDTSQKIIYLTFDEGYENGYTSRILDILKANNVKAAFFATKPYIDSEKALVKRMVAEGHLVCNHSNHHPSMPTVLDKTKFDNELLDTQKDFEELTGTSMSRFFRPPMGEYSELTLYRTQQIGYKTIFWSFAYNDWDPKNQPDTEKAKKLIMSRTHNGGIFLLHAVSKTNTDILDYLIKEWKSQGYVFKTLNELP